MKKNQDNDTSKNKKTYFGYKEVDEKEKASLVSKVFTSVANKYDIMNDLMSLGIHRLWKRFAIELSSVRKEQRVLDLAGGTGDLARLFSNIVGINGEVILADINESMIKIGRDKLTNIGNIENIKFVQGDAQFLPFQEDYFDCVSIGFGLRNVTDKTLALKSIYNVLKPGGRLIILEFSKPSNALISDIYEAYSFKILPKIGQLVANDEESYQYLSESIRMHPDQEQLLSMLEGVGFKDCQYHNMTNGIVAVHRGIK